MNNEDKYIIRRFWKRLNQKFLYKYVGESSGDEGFSIDFKYCSIHGEQSHLVAYNEGGYNCTVFCIECVIKLKKHITKEFIEDIKALKKVNDLRSRNYSKREEWDKKHDYMNTKILWKP